jgi:hypothetical protein
MSVARLFNVDHVRVPWAVGVATGGDAYASSLRSTLR